MPKSLVAVMSFRDTKNGKPQVKLVVIEGEQLPVRLAIQSKSYADMHDLHVGDEKMIIWNEGAEKEEIIRDGNKTGEFRPTYTYDVLSGGAYSSEFIKQSAKESAKGSVAANSVMRTNVRTSTPVVEKTPFEIAQAKVMAMKAKAGDNKLDLNKLDQFMTELSAEEKTVLTTLATA